MCLEIQAHRYCYAASSLKILTSGNEPGIHSYIPVSYTHLEIARLREKALHDEASALQQAKKEGIAMGRTDERHLIIEKMRCV